jgi:hypothetical protein
MYGSAILCSTIMNRNDDVFLPNETWAARNTPVNTPFNDEHIDTDIIGHIIAARPLDAEGKVIADQDESPDYFDIEVDFVVYKDIFPAIAKEILEKAPAGEKFVSMEAKFSNFDYAIMNDGKTTAKIIQRTEDTSFLTKNLRAYGGTGYYEGQRIGRVLRDFRFIGMGNVNVPANPGSEYTKLNDINFTTNDKVESNLKVVLHVTKGSVMKIETLDQANEVIAQLTAKVAELESQAEKNEVEVLKAQLQKANDNLAAEASKLEIANQQINTEKSKAEELTASLEAVKTELQTKKAELDEIHSKAKANERLAKFKDLGIEITDEKRAKIVAMSDEAFASVVEFAQSVKPTEKTEEEPKGDDAAAVAAAEAAAKATLDSANQSNATALETTPGDEEVETQKLQKTAAKLVEAVRSMRKTKK